MLSMVYRYRCICVYICTYIYIYTHTHTYTFTDPYGYVGQEATVRNVRQVCILSPCLFNLYAEYTMRNARLEEVQAGIRIAGRNINHLCYAYDTTLMAESEEELKTS